MKINLVDHVRLNYMRRYIKETREKKCFTRLEWKYRNIGTL